MASEKVTAILKSKTDLSDEQIAGISDGDAWKMVYSLRPPQTQQKNKIKQICFTGFSPSDKERLRQIAIGQGLDVVSSVTRFLAFLVTGTNAGPAKCKLAKEQDVVIMNEEQFTIFLAEGEIPA
jgi:NAD-dependent DNA ligase